MRCLNPPLASKPAKGYSWTCAPCSRKHEQAVAQELEGSGKPAELARLPGNQGSLIRGGSASTGAISEVGHQVKLKTAASSRGPGRPRGSGKRALDDNISATGTPDGSPAPERTVEDIRGVRCCNKWPYRYFGQHTNAPDVLDPHDSIYPRATTRLGPKFQTALPTWEEQKELGIGVVAGVSLEAGQQADEEPTPSTGPTGRGGHAGRARRGRGRGRGGRGGSAALTSRDSTAAGNTSAASEVDTPGGTPTLAPLSLPSDGLESRDSTGPPSIPTPTPAPIREFERGTDESVEVVCDLSKLPPGNEDKAALQDAYMTSAAWHFRPLAPYNLDFMSRAIKVFNDNNYEPIAALQEVSRSTPEDFRIVHWTSRERKAFDIGVKDWGAEVKHLRKLIPTKKPAEIVRYFVQWKNEKLKEQHAVERAAREKAKARGKPPPISERDTVPRSQTMTRAVSPTLSVYEEKTVRDTPSVSCKMCGTSSAPFWFKGPYSWSNRFLCDNCGMYWRKYAAESAHTDLVATNTKKHTLSADDNTSLGVAPPVKVAKLASKPGDSVKTASTAMVASGSSSGATASTSTAVPKPDPIRCVLCRRLEPKKKLQQCRQCSLSVHQGCFGLTDEELAADVWLCDACTNEKTLDAALVPRCILCPPLPHVQGSKRSEDAPVTMGSGNRGRGGKSGNPASVNSGASSVNGLSAALGNDTQGSPLTALDAVKPTECNNWAHLICAAWMPDVAFTDTKRMKLVEGAGNLPWWRYNSSCEICHQPGGACIQCSEGPCKRTFHVSCACTNPGYSLAFEINPVKTSRRDQVATASFKAEQGHWSALAFCKTHRDLAKEKQTYDFFEVDHKTGLTALQTYIRTHKNVGGINSTHASSSSPAGATDSTYALLRRAKRFDAVWGEFEGQASNYMRHHSASIPPGTATPSGGSPLLASKKLNGSSLAQTGSSLNLHETVTPAMQSTQRDASKGASTATEPPPTPQHRQSRHCVRCRTTYSPLWWNVSDHTPAVKVEEGSNGFGTKGGGVLTTSPSVNGAAQLPPGSITMSPPKSDSTGRAVCCNICRFSLESIAASEERKNHLQPAEPTSSTESSTLSHDTLLVNG